MLKVDNNTISTIILTSDYAVMRSMVEQGFNHLTKETRLAMSLAMEKARDRLVRELDLSGLQSILIPKGIDPISIINEVDEDAYASLINDMEAGWYGKRQYKDKFQMTNVGFLRQGEDYNDAPEEMFAYKDTFEALLTMSKEVDNDDDFLMVVEAINKVALAVSIPHGEARDEIISSIQMLAAA